ncbi:hypothetical protein ACEZDB_22170 [Streptacidiphilus sp. N1-3]|uniref:Uncharacterized protein n=1 Tax=Streptacidiphilus alkalitolerans TaxID=3342712 RepID=A0ABV6X509_9ACTN
MNHRRPSHDELTPEDLFRPEPAQGTTIPGEVVRSSEMPWNSPQPQQPEYYGEPQPQAPYQQVQPPAEEASTQFMPPFPAAPQQSYGGYSPQQDYGRGYQPPVPPQAAPPGPAGRAPRRFSPMVIGIAVVAGCAVLGIGVAAAVSGGGSGTGTAGSGASASSSASASSAAGGAPADQAQAQALSDLLKGAANSRSAVVAAVGDIEHCQNLDGAAQDLSAAATSRGQLVQQLEGLQTDKLPDGTELVTALKEGWNASKNADTHYAAWAKQSKSSCDHKHKPAAGGEKRAGDSASSTATVAKQKASRLWDAIASPTGLPKRSSIQL